MASIGVASSVAGVVSLGITICHGLLDYYDSWKDAEQDFTRMRKFISTLSKTFVLLETSIRRPKVNPVVVAQVEENIASCEGGIEQLGRKLDEIKVNTPQAGWKGKAKESLRRSLFPFKEATLVKLRSISYELQDHLSLTLDLLQIDTSAAHLDKLDTLANQLDRATTGVESLVSSQNDEDLTKVYSWLSPLAGEFETKQRNTFELQDRQDGIGNWMLETQEFKG